MAAERVDMAHELRLEVKVSGTRCRWCAEERHVIQHLAYVSIRQHTSAYVSIRVAVGARKSAMSLST
jgi:hypothetical protein